MKRGRKPRPKPEPEEDPRFRLKPGVSPALKARAEKAEEELIRRGVMVRS